MSCEQHHLLTHNPPWAWLLFPLSNLALPFSIIHHWDIIYHCIYQDIFQIFFFVFGYFLPLLLIIGLYSVMIHKLLKQVCLLSSLTFPW